MLVIIGLVEQIDTFLDKKTILRQMAQLLMMLLTDRKRCFRYILQVRSLKKLTYDKMGTVTLEDL